MNPAGSRASSSTRPNPNDRLQARLAKAMAAKTAQSPGAENKSIASPRSSVDTLPSRSSTERLSMDVRSDEKKPGDVVTTEVAPEPATDGARLTPDKSDEKLVVEAPVPEPEESNGVSLHSEPAPDEAPTPKSDTAVNETVDTKPNDNAASPSLEKTDNGDASTLSKEIEELKARQQEEIQEYVERIDSLQSKLQYLSKGAAESARKTAQAASSGTPERKLAEKDEKIALLIEEGQKLSGTEHKLRTIIKKLRQQIADQEKQADTLRGEKAAALAEAEKLRGRLESDEVSGKQQEESKKLLAAKQKEIDSLRKESAAKDEALSKLEQSLRAKAESDAAASVEQQNKKLAAEQAKQKQLEDTIAGLKAENESLVNKSRLEGLEWTEKVQRAQERARTIEAELKVELHTMENKLEAMRSAAEEAVSGGSGGDGQVNLIRQMETLQSQYATASSNWQGIEASLLAKVSSLEKEKDDAQSRESEIRKKAREAVSLLPGVLK